MATKTLPTFRNEIVRDYSLPKERKAMEQALVLAKSKLGRQYPIVIGGEKYRGEDFIRSQNPADPSVEIGAFARGTVELAEKALQTAAATFETWKFVPAEKRAEYLLKAAKIARRRRYEINAWMVLEVGKNYGEADADTAEAIDFLEFYARDMYRLAGHQSVVPNKGEKGYLEYLPLGVGVIVPPWNFPFAILVGTASAAIVTGNTVVLKPSSDSPMMGWIFHEIMEEAGLPKGVLNFFTAPGGEVGDHLVNSPITRFVSFTGSKEIGLRITELAAKHQPGQRWIKRVVAEMGGKDSIIVAKDADLDAAADGIVASAFGFQGQKCSACSRAIIEEAVYPKMVERIVERVNRLEIGDPSENKPVGPVVSKRAFHKILEYIQVGSREGGRVVAGGEVVGTKGYFIKPTVIADVHPEATVSLEEIFGPVLAVIRVKNFDEAIAVANNTEYGLTGAVYSASAKNLAKAEREFFVGNLYLNRKCTGALVGVHPFGGFNMSGTDSKAGGHDYLLLFLQGKSVAQKTLPAKKAIKSKPAAKKPVAKKSTTKVGKAKVGKAKAGKAKAGKPKSGK
jgi:1-pyrroline-5-carboxylate dehydrogenase